MATKVYYCRGMFSIHHRGSRFEGALKCRTNCKPLAPTLVSVMSKYSKCDCTIVLMLNSAWSFTCLQRSSRKSRSCVNSSSCLHIFSIKPSQLYSIKHAKYLSRVNGLNVVAEISFMWAIAKLNNCWHCAMLVKAWLVRKCPFSERCLQTNAKLKSRVNGKPKVVSLCIAK